MRKFKLELFDIMQIFSVSNNDDRSSKTNYNLRPKKNKLDVKSQYYLKCKKDINRYSARHSLDNQKIKMSKKVMKNLKETDMPETLSERFVNMDSHTLTEIASKDVPAVLDTENIQPEFFPEKTIMTDGTGKTVLSIKPGQVKILQENLGTIKNCVSKMTNQVKTKENVPVKTRMMKSKHKKLFSQKKATMFQKTPIRGSEPLLNCKSVLLGNLLDKTPLLDEKIKSLKKEPCFNTQYNNDFNRTKSRFGVQTLPIPKTKNFNVVVDLNETCQSTSLSGSAVTEVKKKRLLKKKMKRLSTESLNLSVSVKEVIPLRNNDIINAALSFNQSFQELV